MRMVPLGPVAVFGASNFPLAFSVAGGDTASALVRDPRIKAVGFTGSRAGGLALAALAAKRPEPIPFYGEMSSINPVLLLPGALAAKGPGLEEFLATASEAVAACPAATMLHKGILAAYKRGVSQLAGSGGVQGVSHGQAADGAATAYVFRTDEATFRATPHLSEEIFGAAGLLVEGTDFASLAQLLQTMEGQLTITMHMTDADEALFSALLPLLETKAGRILVNGWPTGVEVCHAMVHGGPFPSTSDSRTTSVGTLAIRRFLRLVCYQNLAEHLLPDALRDANSLGLWRRMDGVMTAPSAKGG